MVVGRESVDEFDGDLFLRRELALGRCQQAGDVLVGDGIVFA